MIRKFDQTFHLSFFVLPKPTEAMAPPVIPDSLRENMEFMEQLSASFKDRQDKETLSNIQSIHEEILAICQGREADVRETIKGERAVVL